MPAIAGFEDLAGPPAQDTSRYGGFEDLVSPDGKAADTSAYAGFADLVDPAQHSAPSTSTDDLGRSSPPQRPTFEDAAARVKALVDVGKAPRLAPIDPAGGVAQNFKGTGRTIHGTIASTLLGSVTQPIEDVGTLAGINPGQSKPLAATRLALNATGPLLGRVGALGLRAAGVASDLAEPVAAAGVGAATGAANMPSHPIAGALLGTALGAAGAHAGNVEPVPAERTPLSETPRNAALPALPDAGRMARASVTDPGAVAPDATERVPGARGVRPGDAEAQRRTGSVAAAPPVALAGDRPAAALAPAEPPVAAEPPAATTVASAPPEPAQPTSEYVSVRDARGRPRTDLSKVATPDLLDELRTTVDAHASDLDAIPRYTSDQPGESLKLRKEDRGIDGAAQRFEMPAAGAARGAQRQKYIDRMYAELESRGVSTMDMVDHWMERDALTRDDATVPADATDFDPSNFRFAGPGLTPRLRRGIGDLTTAALHGPFEQVRRVAPSVAESAERALAAPASAAHFASEQARWAIGGESPEALRLAMAQKTLDQLRAIKRGGVVSPDEQAALGLEPAPTKATAPQLRLGPAGQDRLDANIAHYEQMLPEGYADSPDFQRINGKLQPLIAQLEGAARKSGVSADHMRQADHGYMRLASPDAAAATGQPVAGVGTGTRAATAAQRATGAGDYTDDPYRMLAADAADKFPKAARNDLYQSVIRNGTPTRLGAPVPEGKAAVFISDKGGVVSDPAAAKFKVITTPEVRAAVDHVESIYTQRPRGDIIGTASRGLERGLGNLALVANPPAMVSHSLTLGSTVGSAEGGGALRALATVAPGGGTASGLRDIFALDRSAPDVREFERNLMAAGGMRPPGSRATAGYEKVMGDLKDVVKSKLGPAGVALDPHEALFGPGGIDPRARVVLGMRYRDLYHQRFGEDPSWSQVAQYVNRRAGNYVRGNGGALVDFLQDSRLSMFARMSSTRLANALRSTVGGGGVPAATRGQAIASRAATIGKAVGGPLVGLEGLNYLLSGHSTLGNAPGHETDLQTARDNADGAPNTYVRGGILHPLLSTASHAGLGSLARGNVKGAARDAGNATLGVAASHPIVKSALALGGAAPYLEREGGLRHIGHPQDTGPAELAARFRNAAAGLTNLTAPLSDDRTPAYGTTAAGRVAGAILPAAVSKGNPSQATIQLRRADDRAVVNDRVRQLNSAAGDTVRQNRIIEDAVRDAVQAGLNPDVRRAGLTKAMNRANNATGGAIIQRFRNQNPGK